MPALSPSAAQAGTDATHTLCSGTNCVKCHAQGKNENPWIVKPGGLFDLLLWSLILLILCQCFWGEQQSGTGCKCCRDTDRDSSCWSVHSGFSDLLGLVLPLRLAFGFSADSEVEQPAGSEERMASGFRGGSCEGTASELIVVCLGERVADDLCDSSAEDAASGITTGLEERTMSCVVTCLFVLP